MQEALLNNSYGIPAGKLGSDLLSESITQLSEMYPHVEQIPSEKVIRIEREYPCFSVITNKNIYTTVNIIVGIGSANTFSIEGLTHYLEPHKKAIPEKNKVQLRNKDHKVANGIYVIGTLAGWRSQLSIAAGSGAAVATDLLTEWNNGIQSQVHDSIRK